VEYILKSDKFLGAKNDNYSDRKLIAKKLRSPSYIKLILKIALHLKEY
jgi:hypothetical protein